MLHVGCINIKLDRAELINSQPGSGELCPAPAPTQHLVALRSRANTGPR